MSLDTVPGRLRKKKSPPAELSGGGTWWGGWPVALGVCAAVAWLGMGAVGAEGAEHAAGEAVGTFDILTPRILLGSMLLMAISGFFSASETAYFSLNRLQLRTMLDSGQALPTLAARHMEHPGKLLASLIMGNTIANILLGVVLAEPMEGYFHHVLHLPPAVAYVVALLVTTIVLVIFAEIAPKVSVVRNGTAFATFAMARSSSSASFLSSPASARCRPRRLLRTTSFSPCSPRARPAAQSSAASAK